MGRLIFMLMMIAALIAPSSMDAQDKKKKKTKYRMRLSYTKDSDNLRTLNARLFYKEKTTFFDVAGEAVTFFIMGEEDETILAEVITNSEGRAILQIEDGYPIPWDDDRMCVFGARFDGNENARAADDEVYITDINIDFEFAVEDEEQLVHVKITKLQEGEPVPVEDAEVYGYIDRMLNQLPIGEDFSDSEGAMTFAFPVDLPGDEEGNLDVIVRINESDEYGTVEMRKTIQWGVPVDFSESNFGRSLWTDEAPVWMSMAVLIILAGAWFNFFFAMYKIWRVKKLGKQTDA